MTPLRQEVTKFIEYWVSKIEPQKILEVGIAGDEKPGGNYKYFKGKDYKTLDIDPRYQPDYIADICDTKLPAESFDLIILSQTIEHIFDKEKAVTECYRLLKEGGHLIVDCPWEYPYHAADDFDDYWRISATAFTKMLRRFKKVETIQGKYCSSALAKK